LLAEEVKTVNKKQQHQHQQRGLLVTLLHDKRREFGGLTWV